MSDTQQPHPPDPTAAQHRTWEIHSHAGAGYGWHHHDGDETIWYDAAADPNLHPADRAVLDQLAAGPSGDELIHAAMAQVVATVEAVAKGNTAKMPGEGSYKFRGIADLMTALSPAWGNAGIYVRGREVGFDQVEGITTSNNKRVTCYLVRMEYDFTARDGSMVTVGPYRGEGRDTMDKALGKAYSMAYKKMLEETFCVPFADSERAEEEPLESAQAEAPPAGWESWAEYDGEVGKLRGRISGIPRGVLRDGIREVFLTATGGLDPADQSNWRLLTTAMYEELEQAVAEAEHGRDDAGPQGDPGPGEPAETLSVEGVPDPSIEGTCAEVDDTGEPCTLAAVHVVQGVDHETFAGKSWPVGPRPVPFTAADSTRDAAAQASRRGRPRAGSGEPAWARRRPGDARP